MTFFEKNEENLEALVFSLIQREKTTIAIGIYDCDDTCDKAIAYVTKELKGHKTVFLDLLGKKINSLLAFFRENIPSNKQESLPIVHITKIDPLLFISENHKVVSSPLVAQINMERELLFHEVEALVVLWLTRKGYNRLRIDAPDFMDWVVASFIFENEGDLKTQKLSFDIPIQTVNDKNKAAIKDLQEKAAQLQSRTLKFEQGTKLTIKDKKEYFNLLLTLVGVYQELHSLGEAQRILEKAYALAKENNLANGFEFGKLLMDWGDIETDLGNLDKALLLFQEGVQHFELLEDKPNISTSLERLGSTHRILGNLDKALGFFEIETKLFKELYTDYPQNVSFKNGLAISYSKLGETYSGLGNLDKALEFFEQYNRLEKELHSDYPQNVSFKNGLAISYSKLGETYSGLGNLDKALEFFEQYNRLEKELHTDYPQNMSFINSLAISYSKLGETYGSLGHLDKALTFFERYNRLAEELYSTYPNNVNLKNNLAVSYCMLAEVSKEKKDNYKAKTYYQAAEKLWLELVQDAPKYVQFQKFLSTVQETLKSLN